MPSTLPEGDPVAVDGSLPDQAYEGIAERGLGFYIHVPFCATRCGYCDFNTYTAGELGMPTTGAHRTNSAIDSWLAGALAEIDLAAKVLHTGSSVRRRVSTVFVGGGTPSLIGAGPLTAVLQRIEQRFGLADNAEVSTEANPESTDPALLAGLREAGYTRLSLGMQSVSPKVLAVLERNHTPGKALEVAAQARAAGFEHLNLDLIYGTPGETDAEFAESLQAVIEAQVDHVSAYSLIVEPGTKLARQVKAGLLPMPDDDVLADRYLLADRALSEAGMRWYEVSNWATNDDAQCRHNLSYWSSGDWWGIGPGAHSHVGGVRWWNVKHPAKYASAMAEGVSPGYAREVLDGKARRVERILLGLRLAAGLPSDLFTEAGTVEAGHAVREGLLEPADWERGRAVLTLQGRLLADGLAIRLLD
ncbi:coproporphyrinogen III oxidase [Nakamurella antarctica]|uniref:Heme chaperone HemW n=1 Tax=Nakamurella antarctica TaxID=1902245 RepID=A0A3G8ZMF1_9ACTN|nr:radical SAM family heme chaperone HemW [Nakamurella antarctica]AZI58420.1 coproporphyrinogen III oxidase [Nakamurella antarctica]